eukprot:4360008-Prymnesium_polylepis.2
MHKAGLDRPRLWPTDAAVIWDWRTKRGRRPPKDTPLNILPVVVGAKVEMFVRTRRHVAPLCEIWFTPIPLLWPCSSLASQADPEGYVLSWTADRCISLHAVTGVTISARQHNTSCHPRSSAGCCHPHHESRVAGGSENSAGNAETVATGSQRGQSNVQRGTTSAKPVLVQLPSLRGSWSE